MALKGFQHSWGNAGQETSVRTIELDGYLVLAGDA